MSDHTSSMTVIGADTQIKGELTFDTTARILGKVEGRITSKGELQIGDSASCKAALDAGKIIVDGTVEGNITARERVTLNSKARVIGDIVAGTLVVVEGASFSGHCRVGPDAGKGQLSQAGTQTQTQAQTQTQPYANSNDSRTQRPAAPARNGNSIVNGAAPENLAAAFAGLEAKLAGINKVRPAEAVSE